MSSVCSSCKYPLTIRDSVGCYECHSYFHIDCAQSVGYLFYELSSDPNRNTFHCTTCELLPLPRTSSSSSDSDISDDMPSRQLDYPLGAPDDLAKEVNEVRGTVQDLQELCKDLFREINELKSINLTLRCCVENIKHDNEDRDGVIAELKRRLDLVERKDDEKDISGKSYSYSREKHVKIQELPVTEPIILTYAHVPKLGRKEQLGTALLEEIEAGNRSEDKEIDWTKQKDEENASWTAMENETDPPIYTKNDEMPSSPDYVTVEIIKDTYSNQQKWQGSKADEGTSKVNEYNSGDESEEEGAVGWENLDDEIETVTSTLEESPLRDTWNKRSNDRVKGEDTVISDVREDYESKWSDEESVHSETSEDTYRILKSEDIDEKDEEGNATQEGDQTQESLEKGVDEQRLADSIERENVGEVAEFSESEPRLEDKIPTDGESRLDADQLGAQNNLGNVPAEGESLGEGEARSEGEATLQESPDGEPGTLGEDRTLGVLGADGESAIPEEPQHTAEDLWEYLKETVTSVHPSTVEEFVQNLIGTLQQVPQEYLKPVIDANIKRANSPSIADEEHIIQEGFQPDEVTPDQAPLTQDDALAAEVNIENTQDNPTTTTPEENPAGETESAVSASQEQTTSDNRNESEEETKGYSALEGDF